MSKNKEKILALTATLLALILAEMGDGGSAAVAEAPATPEPEKGKGKKGEATEGAGDTEEITLEALRELASDLMSDGKADDIKKVLKKVSAESLTKLDKKHYAAVHAKLTELKSL